MDNIKKLENLEEIKNKYLDLREYVVYLKNIYELNYLEQEKGYEKENVKVKKLVLSKPFHGKNLIVG